MPDKFKDAVEKRILVIGKKPKGFKVEGKMGLRLDPLAGRRPH